MMALAPIVGNPYSTVKALYRSAKLSNSSTVKSFLISVCVVILDSSLVSCVRNYSVVSAIHFPFSRNNPLFRLIDPPYDLPIQDGTILAIVAVIIYSDHPAAWVGA